LLATIDHVRAPGGGRIGLVRCPGTRVPLIDTLPAPPDADADLRALVDWGARALVTLVEPFELDLLGVPELGERARAHGMAWWHLPIIDGSAPGSAFERRWPETAPELHALLDADGRIVVHCRAGLGRSGAVAARLLVERGSDPHRALAAVRRARPGAVETGEQAHWVLDLRATRPPPMDG